ncbi:hypothetical protein, partial [Streptomyces zhihengii]|uniref:hypothetical protein n=1 Tax=Streptomyces zhihengii TaxID=1818004 RepID=UPI0033A24A91
MADALPDFRPSASTGHALADPAADHRYGAIGFEIEIPQMLNWESSTGNAYGTLIAIHRPSGSRLEVDTTALYEVNGAYYAVKQDAEAHGTPVRRNAHIPEFISAPAGVFVGERPSHNAKAILELADSTRRMLRIGAGKVAGEGKEIGNILRKEDGWEVSSQFEHVRIEPAPQGDWGSHMYTQFTVGFPAGGILPLLEKLAEMHMRGNRDELIQPSREFGRALAKQFVGQYYRRPVGPGEIDKLKHDPLVREVWGYGWLLFNHAAAAPLSVTVQTNTNVLVKNYLLIALRNPLGEVRNSLQEPVRNFLRSNAGGIGELFNWALGRLFREVNPAHQPRRSYFATPLSDDCTVGDYFAYALGEGRVVTQSVAVGMHGEQYNELTTHLGTQLILGELRHPGKNHGLLLPRQIPEYFNWLGNMVQPFFAEDQTRLWQRALRSYSGLSDMVDYRPGSRFWDVLSRAAEMGLSPDPTSASAVAFVAQKLREGVSGPSGVNVVVRRAEVGGVLEGLRRVYADKGLPVKARAVLGGILASWESNAGMPVLPPGVVSVPSALPEDMAPSRSSWSVDAVLGRGVRVLDRVGLEAVAGEV